MPRAHGGSVTSNVNPAPAAAAPAAPMHAPHFSEGSAAVSRGHAVPGR
jgi:hypothetical protein